MNLQYFVFASHLFWKRKEFFTYKQKALIRTNKIIYNEWQNKNPIV